MNTILSFFAFLGLLWFLSGHVDHEKVSRLRGELGFHRVEMGR
jgi:hypothetical protein